MICGQQQGTKTCWVAERSGGMATWLRMPAHSRKHGPNGYRPSSSVFADFVDEPDTLLQEHPHLLIAIGVAVLIMAGSLCWCARTSGGCGACWEAASAAASWPLGRCMPPSCQCVLSAALIRAECCTPTPRHAGRNSRPEYEVALSQGYKLEEPLGSGHYGRVYRARDVASGQVKAWLMVRCSLSIGWMHPAFSWDCPMHDKGCVESPPRCPRPSLILPSATLLPLPQLVAVKVIDLLPSQRRQVAAALHECDLMSGMDHECVVKLHKFYSAQVRRHRHQVLDKG